MTIDTVALDDAGHALHEILAHVRSGESLVLTEGGKPLAQVIPIPRQDADRVLGLHRGAIWTSEDFDDELSPDVLLGEP